MSNNYLRPSTDEGAANLLVKLLSQDVPQGQFIRELTQNAIEAIQDKGGNGRVRWCAERERWPAPKLQIIDNGGGFDPDDLERILHELLTDSKELGVHGNFGIGGRISTLKKSPAGVVYDTWRNGVGRRCVMRWPDQDRAPRLMQFSDGQRVRRLQEAHPWESESGTRVTLIGESEDQDTTKNPGGTLSGTRMIWVYYYLNRRYYDFPDGIDVYVERPPHQRGKQDNYVQAQRVPGLQESLDNESQASGVVPLDGANILWWVLSPREEANVTNRQWVPAHIGSVWRGELHDAFFSGITKTSRLGAFGVTLATKRIAIHVAPNESEWHPNAQRSRLMHRVSGEEIPWEDLGEAFRDQMPEPIEKVEEEMHAERYDSFDPEGFYDLLREMGIIDFSRFYAGNGTRQGEDQSPSGPEEVGGLDTEETSDQSQSDKDSSIFDEGTEPREPKPPKSGPNVEWVDEPDTDEIARYVPETNRIVANPEHHIVTKLSKLIARHANGNAQLSPKAAKHLLSRRLVEHVLCAEEQKEYGWDQKSVHDAWTPWGLTSSSLTMYDMVQDGLEMIRSEEGKKILTTDRETT